MNARCTLLIATLLLAGSDAQAANPPNAMDDLPPRIILAPVDMMPAAPRAGERELSETPATRPGQPVAKPSEPSANPLWAIPLSRLTATRDRPLFLPSRRAPAPGVATPVATPTPSAPLPAEPERPSLTLVGAIASETEGFAVFLDQATNTVIRLRTGQDHQGWVLRAVKGREATLVKASISTTLMLPEPGNFGAPVAPAVPADIRRQPNGEPEL